MPSKKIQKKQELKERHKRVREERRSLREEYQHLKSICRGDSCVLRNYERAK
jgi:hypothetical protein